MSDQHKTTMTVRGWHGRTAQPGSMWSTRSGYREAVWRRDQERGWIEESATMRPVIGFRANELGDLQPILGEPRHV